MKEEFDISRYLNIEMAPELKQSLSDFHSKRAISAKLEKKQAEQSEQSESSPHSSASEQTLPSESLNGAKEAVKAAHSEQEKQQAVSSIPRRISHKQ